MRVWMVLFGVAAFLGAARGADQQQLSDSQIEEITQKFAAKESEFARARDNYTYRQTARVQELDEFGNVRGVWEMVSDIVFPDGKRSERVVRAPVSTLRDLQLEPADEQDLRNVLPFVLNTAELPKYFVRYLGKQNIDEIPCFVFAVKPKKLDAGQRYFQGEVWVDDRDLQIDGKYWFPTYTRADDVLYFQAGPQRMRLLVRYEDYKQFKSESQIKYGEPVESKENKKP
jgi:hypothetical protein